MNGLNSALFNTPSLPSLFPPSFGSQCPAVFVLLILHLSHRCPYYAQDHPLTSQGHDGNKVKEMNAKGSPWSRLSWQPRNYETALPSRHAVHYSCLYNKAFHHFGIWRCLPTLCLQTTSLVLFSQISSWNPSCFAHEPPHCPSHLHHTFLLQALAYTVSSYRRCYHLLLLWQAECCPPLQRGLHSNSQNLWMY